MRLSARAEYAIKAVLDLTLHRSGELIPIQDIAARQGIPQRYLEQVLLALKRAGLLTSKRGSSGGYDLTRPPEDIPVVAVLLAVEGDHAPFEALARPGDDRDLAELWTEIAEAVSRVIDGLTFAELAARVRERRTAVRSMYYI
jgi:Rrf2 family transcriptional regulator, cysteine metabolism repressor